MTSVRAGEKQYQVIDVNDGRTRIGSIVPQSKSSFQARDSDGSLLGVFATKAEAVAAIWVSAREAPQ